MSAIRPRLRVARLRISHVFDPSRISPIQGSAITKASNVPPLVPPSAQGTRAAVTSVWMKSSPLNSRGSPVALARA